MTEKAQAETEIKVLLVAPNWLGDAVMFSALIEFLHSNRFLKDGRSLVLDLAIRSQWAPLFKADNRLKRIFIVDRGGRHGGLLGGWKLGSDFRHLKPDAVLLGPPSFRAGFAALRSGAGIRVGYESDGRNPMLNFSLPVPARGSLHHCEELVGLGQLLMNALGDQPQNPEPQTAEPFLPGCESFPIISLQSSTPIWVFAPGATYGSAKSWPLSQALEFVRTAIGQREVRLVVLGDSAASNFAQGLADGLNLPLSENLEGGPGLVDLTGRTDLGKVVSILKVCRVFVGNDSGLMHLAAALSVPTVGVFGSSNPEWTSPRGPLTRVVSAEGFSCRPCYLKSCNQKEFCMETIKAPEIFAAIDQLLSCNG